MVAQSYRPIGPVFSIEQVQRNMLLKFSNGSIKASPINCLQRVLADLSERERELVRHSLFLSVERSSLRLNADGAASEASAFLIRNLIGVDPNNGAVRGRC